jgi:hypothetical protein
MPPPPCKPSLRSRALPISRALKLAQAARRVRHKLALRRPQSQSQSQSPLIELTQANKRLIATSRAAGRARPAQLKASVVSR